MKRGSFVSTSYFYLRRVNNKRSREIKGEELTRSPALRVGIACIRVT